MAARTFRPFLLAVTFTALTCASAYCARSEQDGYVEIDRNNFSLFHAAIIDSVIIDNRDIYDIRQKEYDRFIFRWVNRLHIQTREHIIRQELLLENGSRFDTSLAVETARNLRLRLELYDAWLEGKQIGEGHMNLKVVTIDQWSLKGGFELVHEGNQTRYNIGVEEDNLLGLDQFLSLYYYSQPDDDNYIEAGYSDDRVAGYPLRFAANFSNNPESELTEFGISRPFYDILQSTSFGVSASYTGGRRDVMRNADVIAHSYRNGDRVNAFVDYRLGSLFNKMTIGLEYTYRFEDIFDQKILNSTYEDSALAIASFPNDSMYHQFDLKLGLDRFAYYKTRRIDGFGYAEDFALGVFADFSVGRAFSSGFNSHRFDQLGLALSRRIQLGNTLVFIDWSGQWWLREGDWARKVTGASARTYTRAAHFLTIAGRLAYSSDWDAEGANRLVLGGTTGVRGLDEFYKTGDRRIVGNVEARFYTGLRLLSVLFGGVLFSDAGGIWKRGEQLATEDFGFSAGLGLRLAFENSSRNIVRIDLAFSDQEQWQLSVGTHQYFQAGF